MTTQAPDWQDLCKKLVALLEQCPVTTGTDWAAKRNELTVTYHKAAKKSLVVETCDAIREGITKYKLTKLFGVDSSRVLAFCDIVSPQPSVEQPASVALQTDWVPVHVKERPWLRDSWCDENGYCWWSSGTSPSFWWYLEANKNRWKGFMLPACAIPKCYGNS